MSEVATTSGSTNAAHPVAGHDAWEADIARIQRPALIIGLVGIVLTALGMIIAPHSAFKSYLWAFMYWSLFPLGSLAFLMIQHMTGGYWGLLTRRILEASASLVVLTAVFSIPLLFMVITKRDWFYPWTHASAENNFHGLGEYSNPDHLWFKSRWLSSGSWVFRAILYFAIWSFLALSLYKWSGREDQSGSTPKSRYAARRIAAPGLLLFVLCGTFAMIDWIMSLDPSWYSTMFGVLYVIGQALASMAFTIVILRLVADREPIRGVINPIILNDVGNLMFAFTIFWAYVNFSQLLIIWSANIAEETPYYYVRSSKGWLALSIVIALGHFFIPFLLLLWRKVKRNIRLLAMVAVGILVMRAVDLFWVIKPMWIQREFTIHVPIDAHDKDHGKADAAAGGHGEGKAEAKPAAEAHPAAADPHAAAAGNPDDKKRLDQIYPKHHTDVKGVWEAGFHWTDIPAIAGMGGIWVAAFAWRLRQRPLIPPNDPRLAELAAAGHH
jgi:hypothetical protein